jgi:hypothetical protein
MADAEPRRGRAYAYLYSLEREAKQRCNRRRQRLSEEDDYGPNMFASLARALASKPAYNLRPAR